MCNTSFLIYSLKQDDGREETMNEQYEQGSKYLNKIRRLQIFVLQQITIRMQQRKQIIWKKYQIKQGVKFKLQLKNKVQVRDKKFLILLNKRIIIRLQIIIHKHLVINSQLVWAVALVLKSEGIKNQKFHQTQYAGKLKFKNYFFNYQKNKYFYLQDIQLKQIKNQFTQTVYSDFSQLNIINNIIYQKIAELLKFITLIAQEAQNTIIVNKEPLIIYGKEIIWQMKRTSKQIFNQQFHIKKTEVDYLIDFIQYESTYLKTNPIRFTSDLDYIIQQQFNDKTIQIFLEHYYQVKLTNIYNSRFLISEEFSSIYSLKFGSYKVCSYNNEILQKYQIICMMRTISGKFYQCILNTQQIDDIIELTCECNKFGDIFLTTSTNFSYVIQNQTNKQIFNFDITSRPEDQLVLIIFTSSLTLIFMIICIINLCKDQKNELEQLDTQSSNLDSIQNKNSPLYSGDFKLFKQKLKLIHQTISIFYYRDKNIQLSYRILEVFSQFNLQLTLVILECFLLNNKILLVCVFIIVNPILILILRIKYKIIEAIYRFRGIASVVSQFFLLIFLLLPNLILIILYQYRISQKSEYYVFVLIFLGNTIISQVIIEPLTIFVRIYIYRRISSSIKNMDLNPKYHLVHFFIMHSCLEDIFEEFTRI